MTTLEAAAEAPPETYDELFCHCGDGLGHTPGGYGCTEALVKPVSVRPFSKGPAPGTAGSSVFREDTQALRPYKAKGTCPGCGAKRSVERVGVYGTLHTGNRILLAREPRISEHAVKGQVEPCAGGFPTELRFTPGREVASWAAVHGVSSIVRATK